MGQKIVGKFIIEIAGKPKENVVKALEVVLDKLKSEKERFKFIDAEIEEPSLDENTTLYAGLIDVELKFSDVIQLFYFIEDYLPTSIEIIEPEELILTNNDLTESMNSLSQTILKHHNMIRNLNAQLHLLLKDKNK